MDSPGWQRCPHCSQRAHRGNVDDVHAAGRKVQVKPAIALRSTDLAMEPCPHCNKMLDPQLCFVRGSLSDLPSALLSWERPSVRRARKFTVRCPHCTKTYVSNTLRRFGFVTHRNYVIVVGLVCFAVVAMVLLARPRG